jgi:hypothetical protein
MTEEYKPGIQETIGLKAQQATENSNENNKVYADLSNVLIARSRKTTAVQELMQHDAREEIPAKQEYASDLNIDMIDQLVAIDSAMKNYALAETSQHLFDKQEEVDELYAKGIIALPLEKAQLALKEVQKQVEQQKRQEAVQEAIIELQRGAWNTTYAKMQEATQTKDTKKYLHYWYASQYYTAADLTTVVDHKHGGKVPDIPTYMRSIEESLAEDEKAELEAKTFSNLKKKLEEMPQDVSRPRLAMTKIVSSEGKEEMRVLADFPEGTYRYRGGKPEKERTVFYSGGDTLICLQNAYRTVNDSLNEIPELKDQEIKGFYIGAFHATGIESHPEFPEEAKHILRVGLPDSNGEITFPENQFIKMIQEKYPDVLYAEQSQEKGIGKEYHDQIRFGSQGIAHFTIAKDENNRIIEHQDELIYSMATLQGEFTNISPGIDLEKMM